MLRKLVPRTIAEIPIPTTYIVSLSDAKNDELLAHFNKAQQANGKFLVWNSPPTPISAEWSLAMETRVATHVRSGRFDRMRRIFVIGCPNDVNQARTLHAICPSAQIIYVGGDLNKPSKNPHHQQIMNAVSRLVRAGHKLEQIIPEMHAQHIVSRILTGKKDELPAGIDSATLSLRPLELELTQAMACA